MSIYLRTLRYFRAFTFQTLMAVLLMSAGIGFNLLKPWPFKYIVDGVLDITHGTTAAREVVARWFGWAGVEGAVIGLSLAMALLALLSGYVGMLSNVLLIKIGLKALLHLRTQLYSCLQALPLQFHDARRSSDSSFRVAYDSQSIQTIYNKGFATIFGALVTLVSALTIMFRMNWQLTLVSLVVLLPWSGPSAITATGFAGSPPPSRSGRAISWPRPRRDSDRSGWSRHLEGNPSR